MCIGEGQIQAGLLREEDLGSCCSGEEAGGFSKDLTNAGGVALKVAAR